MSDYFTVSEVLARLLEIGVPVSRQYIYKLISDGKLPYKQSALSGKGKVRPGGKIILYWPDIERRIVSHEQIRP